MRVDNGARSGGIRRIFLIFYNMKVYCVLSLESPHWGDSNEYTQYTFFNIKKENHTKFSNLHLREFFLGTQERVGNSHGKRAISVRAIEVLLYMYCSVTFHSHFSKSQSYIMSKIWHCISFVPVGILALLQSIGKAYQALSQYSCQKAIDSFYELPQHQLNTGWVLCQVGRAYFEMQEHHQVSL